MFNLKGQIESDEQASTYLFCKQIKQQILKQTKHKILFLANDAEYQKQTEARQ